jgi:hypothetical protein
MRIFYWVMGVLIVGTFVPSALYLLTYAATGDASSARRARALWNYSRLFTMMAFNILVWGHVFVALWQLKFR